MPDMDGYELIRRVRKREEQSSRRTLAIAISAYAGSEDRQRALLRGYQMHMSKSIEALELIAAVASVRHPTPS